MPSPEPAHRADVAPEFPPYRSATAVQANEGAQNAWKRPSMSSCHPPEIRSADREKPSEIRRPGIFRRPSGDFSQNTFGIAAIANGYSVDSQSSAELL